MSDLITWKASTSDREPEIAEVLQQMTDCVYIHPEIGKDRWIPRHWIIEEEGTDV